MIAVVVPAYCERDHIAEVISTLPDLIDIIVVVDDASPDDTSEVARGTLDPRLRLVTLDTNVGAGGAVKVGHQVALAAGADICVVMDGDGQMDPAYLPALLEPVSDGRCGYAKGTRFYSRDSLRGMPPVRIIGNAVVTVLMQIATGRWHLSDPLNGYTAIRADVLRSIDLDRTGNGVTFLLDTLGLLAESDVPVQDVRIPARYGAETSTIRLSAVAGQLLYTPLTVMARRFDIDSRGLNVARVASLGAGTALATFGAIRLRRHRLRSLLWLSGAAAAGATAVVLDAVGERLGQPFEPVWLPDLQAARLAHQVTGPGSGPAEETVGDG